MGDLSLGDKNFSDAGTDLFIDDAPFDNSGYLLWVDAMLVLDKDVIGVIGMGGNGGAGVWAESKRVRRRDRHRRKRPRCLCEGAAGGARHRNGCWRAGLLRPEWRGCCFRGGRI